jgi:hypothetical protein
VMSLEPPKRLPAKIWPPFVADFSSRHLFRYCYNTILHSYSSTMPIADGEAGRIERW